MKTDNKALLNLGYSLLETSKDDGTPDELIMLHSYSFDEDGLLNVTGIDFSDFFLKNSGISELQSFQSNVLSHIQNSKILNWKFSKNTKFTIMS